MTTQRPAETNLNAQPGRPHDSGDAMTTTDTGAAPTLPGIRSGILPENVMYADTGCHLHPSCLRCPRAACIYDDLRVNDRELFQQERRAEITRRLAAGEPVVHIAAQLGIATRTVYRVRAGGSASHE